MIELLVFDFGNTLIHQVNDFDRSLAVSDTIVLIPGARATLQALSQEYRLVLLSNTHNTTSERLTEVCDKLELTLYFQGIFTSYSLGVRKPHAAAFKAVLDHCHTVPQRAAMVGNSYEEDILGALNIGMYSIHVSGSPRSATPLPDLTIRSIEELTSQAISQLGRRRPGGRQ